MERGPRYSSSKSGEVESIEDSRFEETLIPPPFPITSSTTQSSPAPPPSSPLGSQPPIPSFLDFLPSLLPSGRKDSSATISSRDFNWAAATIVDVDDEDGESEARTKRSGTYDILLR